MVIKCSSTWRDNKGDIYILNKRNIVFISIWNLKKKLLLLFSVKILNRIRTHTPNRCLLRLKQKIQKIYCLAERKKKKVFFFSHNDDIATKHVNTFMLPRQLSTKHLSE
jgi:hypothetical protein